MKKQLYEVFYEDSLTGKLSQKLVVSDSTKISDYIEKLIRLGDIETNQKNPTVLGYSYIDGYKIVPMNEDIEDIVKRLEEESKWKYPILENRVVYLEALRDILKETNQDWKEETPEIKWKIYSSLRSAMGGSNIPAGYNDEGERI